MHRESSPLNSGQTWIDSKTKEVPDSSRTFHVILIKPSLYDQDGYVMRYGRGVLPSNTLACLNGLTEKAGRERVLGPDMRIETEVFDEIVDRVDPALLAQTYTGRRAVFCLCGVQTNMFSRAADIARQLREHGQPVMIGGFHISGVISVFKKPAAELEELMKIGVSLVAGEVEEEWAGLLKDAFLGRLKPLYNFLGNPPALNTEYLPHLSRSYLEKFAVKSFGTMDCGRGCPFQCSFCTIINVHGRVMRNRETEHLREHFRKNLVQNGIDFYFFTDDNFARNKRWEEILDVLTGLRSDGYKIGFMMQVDTLAYKIPGFVEKATAAGCTQVFIGMESLNPENLESAGKRQNRVSDFRTMIDVWRNAGVKTHVGYIIGFPHDTADSVRRNIETLSYDVGVELASFFVLTPLPGSEDHRNLVTRGAPMDSDLNAFDSFRPVTDHPLMTRGEWAESYWEAWKTFYSWKRMAFTLKELRGARLKDMFISYAWYKYAIFVNRTHPMVCGFRRLKDRTLRRPGFRVEARFRFALRRIKDNVLESFRMTLLLAQIGALVLRFLPRFFQRDNHPPAGAASPVAAAAPGNEILQPG